ncbi:MAG: YihA family ribosome biogenesis GTP-binding protein [Rickettsiales bacterium]|nr:YihA family ribosome biogenesis GTP-binding protein [Rickettsiales bacterium]
MKKCEEFFLKNKPSFLYGITNIKQLKERTGEVGIAFIGKSNVGKSSLINAITNSKISISSKTPGRTREINFFNIANKIIFADMPGYGFALASEEQKSQWRYLIYDYLNTSKKLKLIFVLIDSRKGLMSDDIDLLYMLDELNINYQIILTKIDCINKSELQDVLVKTNNELVNHTLANKSIIAVSSSKKYGLFEIKDIIYNLIK